MASSFSPSKGTSRNTRVCRLLVDLCPSLLRDILRHDLPKSQFNAKLRRKEGVLKNRLLNKDQCKLLFPAPGTYYNNDYSDIDSALLYILIRTLCSYDAHKRGWGLEPRAKDVSVSACVERIRIARNKYVAHMSRFDMDGPTFLSIWAEIRQVVVELEKVLSPSEKSISPSTSYEIEMDKLETDPLDPEMEQFYKEKIEQQKKAFHEEQEKIDHVRRNILANTRSRISYHSSNCYVATKAAQAIIDQLKSKSIAIVAGCPGSGKTTTVLEVMKNLVNESNESYTPIILDNPEYWDQVVNSSERMVIFLDDPMGKSNFDRLNFMEWEKKFNNMISCSKNGNCCIIIAIRDIVLKEMNDVCRPNSLFTQQNTINISNGDFKLDNNEKLQIIEQYQVTNKRDLSAKDKSSISKSQPYYGFPQMCFLFFTNESLFELGVSFFSRPDNILVNEIEKLRKSDKRANILQYYILVYVLIYRKINALYNTDHVVAEIGTLANLVVRTQEIKDSIEELDDIYMISKEDTNQEFMFRHQTIREAVLISYFKVNPKIVIKNCSLEDLGELIRTDRHPRKDQEVVLIVAKTEYQHIVDRFSFFDPSCVELLECCVFNEWIGILEILFLKDETLLNRTDDYGMTLITYAALWKRKELVMYLYGSKANVKHVNKFGSCLHFCVLNGWTDLLDIIFADDPTLVDHTDAYNMTLIEYAAKHKQKDMALYLYKYKANIMNVFQPRKLFLKYCVDHNWHDILSVILENDKELVNVEVTPNHSMITYAASQKKLDIVKQFLDIIKKAFDGFDLNCLLQICIDNDWCELLNTLFKDKSSLVNTTNKNGISLLSYAAHSDNKHMVEFLLKQGAEPNSISFLENCIDNEWYDVLNDVLTESPSLVDFRMGDKDFTLICYAASVSCKEAIVILLQHKANIQSCAFLNICVDNELIDVIETILTQQPTLVNFTNHKGDTLINYAAKMKKKDIVLLLIADDVLIKQDDSICDNLIPICAKNEWYDVLEILLKTPSNIVDINGGYGSATFASDTPEEMVIFLYKYIPNCSLSDTYVQMLFQNFVLQERFQALETLMLDYHDCSFENVLDYFEKIPVYIIPGEIDATSLNVYGMPGETDRILWENKRISDELVYKVLCIDQGLVKNKTPSPMFRYCLDKRPQIAIRYINDNTDIDANLQTYSCSVIFDAAFFSEKTLVLSLIDQWANDTKNTKDDMVTLMRFCINNNWEDVIDIMINMERTFKPFLDDNIVILMNIAAERGLSNLVNTLYHHHVKNTHFKYTCRLFRSLSKDIIAMLINHNYYSHLYSNMFLCVCVDNELTYVIDIILFQQPDLINSTNPDGETLICYAARTKKKNTVLLLLKHEASIGEDNLADTDLIKSCALNEWKEIIEAIFKKKIDVNGIFSSSILASELSKDNVVFLYKLIPSGSIVHGSVHKIFRNFVSQERFHVLELLMRDYPECTVFDDDLNNFEHWQTFHDDLVYKIMCIDERLADGKTASSTLRYCLHTRPQTVLRFMETHQNVWHSHIDGETVMCYLATRMLKRCVLDMIMPWARDQGTTIDDMFKLMKLCRYNQWDDIILIMMSLDLTCKPFIWERAVSLMVYAADNSNSDLVNTLLKFTVEKNDGTDNYFRFFKMMVDDKECKMLSILLQHHCKPEYLQNDKGESLFLYASSCGNRQIVEILVEKLDFKDFLGKDIDTVLQKYIDNDWDGIILNLYSKLPKQVSDCKFSEVIHYALTNDKRYLIVSLLEHDKDFKRINKGLIIKHCIDHEWDDVLQVAFSNDNSLVNVLNVNGMHIGNYAARFGKEKFVKHLCLSNTSSFCHIDTNGHTAIHYCIAKGWICIVHMILKQMPQLLVRTHYGVSCIHLAAFFGQMSLFKSLQDESQTLTKNTSFGFNTFQMILLGLRYESKQSLEFPFRKQCKRFYMDIYEKELLTFKTFDSSGNHEYEALITYISLKPNFQAIDLDFPLDKYGNSIIHYLVINDNQTLVNWVLERRDKLKFIKNVTLLPSVLHIAAYLGRSVLFKTFLDCGSGATCKNESLYDAVKAGCKFAGQSVHNSPSGWINQDMNFMHDIKIKAVKYVEFQFGEDEEFATIQDSLSVRLYKILYV